MKAPISELDVLNAIRELEVEGKTATQLAILNRIGGSQRTIQRHLDHLRDLGAIPIPAAGPRLLQACLCRRTTQVDAMLNWSDEVMALATAANVELPPLPDIVGPGQLGSQGWSWPNPAGANRELFAVIEVDEPAVPDGSATVNRHAGRESEMQGVPTQAVDTQAAQRMPIGQVDVSSGSASMDTPGRAANRSPDSGCAPDRRSVPLRTDSQARHPDLQAGGAEAHP